MMKRTIVSLLLALSCLLSPALQAQDQMKTPPDYKRIQKEVQDKKGPRYYPKLVKRLAKGDPTLSDWDYEALYYGQQFQDGYTPYPHYAQFDDIRALLHQDTLTQDDVHRIVALADAVIKKYPAEPQAYYYKLIAYTYQERNHGGDTNLTRRVEEQFWPLVRAIAGSGDGFSPESAMWVVATSHEYLVMNLLGAPHSGQSLSFVDGHTFDSFTLEENEAGIDTLWFNIDAIWAKNIQMFSNLGDDEPRYDPKKKVTALDIPLGTYVELELVKAKKKNSQFRVLKMEEIADTLVADGDSLFRDPVMEGRLVGYFVPARLSEGSDRTYTCFIFKANFGDSPLEYDTEILLVNRPDFQSTSNSGIYPRVVMNEMWSNDIQTLRITNIRE